MSNKNVIPAEALGQWRSWKMDELGEKPDPVDALPGLSPEQAALLLAAMEPPDQGASAILAAAEPTLAAAPEDDPAAELAPVSAAAYPTAAELEAIHQEAWQAGFDAGKAEGLDRGRAEGAEQALLDAQQKFQAYWAPLSELQKSFEAELDSLSERLSAHVLALAVDCAEKLVGQVVQHDAAILQNLLADALAQLTEQTQQLRVRAHPDELATLQAFLGEQYPQWRMQWVPDATLARGGCRIDTAAASLDLSLETRMHLLRESLGLIDEQVD